MASMGSIRKRLDALQEVANRNRPCQMKITFVDGSTIVTDPAGAINLMHDLELCDGKIVNVEANQPGYEALAGLLVALCRPVQNRDISD